MSGAISLSVDLVALLRSRRAAQDRARRKAERRLKDSARQAAFDQLVDEVILPRAGSRPLRFRGLHLVSLQGELTTPAGHPVHRVAVYERHGGGFAVSLAVAPGPGRANTHHLAFEADDAETIRATLLAAAPDAGLCVDHSCAETTELDRWASALRDTITARREDLAALVTRVFHTTPTQPPALAH